VNRWFIAYRFTNKLGSSSNTAFFVLSNLRGRTSTFDGRTSVATFRDIYLNLLLAQPSLWFSIDHCFETHRRNCNFDYLNPAGMFERLVTSTCCWCVFDCWCCDADISVVVPTAELCVVSTCDVTLRTIFLMDSFTVVRIQPHWLCPGIQSLECMYSVSGNRFIYFFLGC
jgi:hypothetical protein